MTYESGSAMDSPSTGDQIRVDPTQLTAQGERFAQFGDALYQHATNHQVQPPKLGTSPPAVNFVRQLAALTGDTGAVALITAWAGGLTSMADNQRAAAATYTDTDSNNADNLGNIVTDV
jgi:hypothetical protein